MFKKFLTLLLVGLLFNTTAVSFVYADTKSDKEARFAEKVKKGIAKLGTGESALVEVKLRDNTKVRGYIKEANDTSFTIVNRATNTETVVTYPNTKQVRGNNLSTGAKVAIGLAILAGVLAIWLIFENYG